MTVKRTTRRRLAEEVAKQDQERTSVVAVEKKNEGREYYQLEILETQPVHVPDLPGTECSFFYEANTLENLIKRLKELCKEHGPKSLIRIDSGLNDISVDILPEKDYKFVYRRKKK